MIMNKLDHFLKYLFVAIESGFVWEFCVQFFYFVSEIDAETALVYVYFPSLIPWMAPRGNTFDLSCPMLKRYCTLLHFCDIQGCTDIVERVLSSS